MENINDKRQCDVHDGTCSFYDYTNNHIRINDESIRSLDDEQLKQIEEIQQMMNKGYELRLVRSRKANKIMWCRNPYICESQINVRFGVVDM